METKQKWKRNITLLWKDDRKEIQVQEDFPRVYFVQ